MGTTQSFLDETSFYRMDYNEELKISGWDTYPSKNIDYYKGERYFKVSRSLYPQYTRGYLYGYYEDENYYKPLESLEEERAF